MSDHSQCGETQWILDNLKPKVGTFVEIGAFDGVQSSNTILLEELGWEGICVEADPVLAAQCQSNRKCMTICAAVGVPHMFDRLQPFYVNKADRGLSGLTQKWSDQIWVPQVGLDEVIKLLGRKNGCDLLSIDTEGTELGVWTSGGGWTPKIVIMEYQTRDLPSNEQNIFRQMTNGGYKQVHKTQYNLIFTRD